jgi:hypothetical protein
MPRTTSTLPIAAATVSAPNAAAGSACWERGVASCQCSESFPTVVPATTKVIHAHSTSSDPARDRSSGGTPSPVSPEARRRSRVPERAMSKRILQGTRPPPVASAISSSSSSP